MTIYLKQSTASQEIPLGYFVDSTDGNTEETGLTINNTDILLWKAGGTTAAAKHDGGATHISNGLYYCVLDDTDTGTVGPLVVFCHVSGALAVKQECMVLAANVYDSLVAGSDKLYVDMIEISSDSTAADNLEAACDGNTYNVGGGAVVAASVTGAVGSVTGAVGSVTGAVGSVTAEVSANVTKISGDATAADNCESFFDGTGYAGTNNVIPSVTTVTTTTNLTNANPSAATIADAVWDEAATGHTDAGKAGQQLWTDVDAILADTGTDGVLVAAGAITATTIADNAIDLATFAADCKTGSALKANVETITAGAITATAIADNAIDLATFAADCKTGSALKANVETITNGAITAAAIATDAIDADALKADALAEIADAVWDEASTGHVDSGKAGAQLWTDIDAILEDTGTTLPAAIPSAATIADAVWDEASTGHVDAGKAGQQLWTDVDAILTDTGTTLDAYIKRILGLSHENFMISSPVFDEDANMTSAVITLYPTKADTDAGTNAIATYAITATYDGDTNLSTYKMTQET